MSRIDSQIIAMKIGDILAGDFACANVEGKLTLWRTTLSIADAIMQSDLYFNRSDFYERVFGNRNHFAVRDALCKEAGLPTPE